MTMRVSVAELPGEDGRSEDRVFAAEDTAKKAD